MPAHKIHYLKTFVCKTCGKEFQKSSIREYQFCSYKCKGVSMEGKYLVKHTCELCGKEFERHPCRQGRFCSRKCALYFGCKQPRKKRETVTYGGKIAWNCKNCGKEMYTFKSRVQECCSQKCAYEYWPTKKPRKTNAPGYYYRGKNWSSQAKLTRTRDNYTCAICKGYGKDAHHIKKFTLFNGDWKTANELSNLITLCRPCHRKVDTGKLSLPSKS